MKGLKSRYLIKQCDKCKEYKTLHSFTKFCENCKKEIKKEKYHLGKQTKNRIPLVATFISDGTLVKGKTNKDLIKNLIEGFNFRLPSASISASSSKIADDLEYWYYKGLIILLEENFSNINVEKIISHRAKDRKKGYKRKNKVSKEKLEQISEILTLRKSNKLTIDEISKRLNISKSYISHVLTGRIYSNVTGIVYKKQYNSYDSEGNIIESKQSKSTKIYNK